MADAGGRGVTEMEALLRLGRRVEHEPALLPGAVAELLRVRDRDGRIRALWANPAQRRFEERRGQSNIVLKARQMGMTTWVAARFFLKTITQPGTLTLQVAHTHQAAEGMLAMTRRMWEELPAALREGPLRLRRSNAGQMIFAETGSEIRVASAADGNAGRGLSVGNLHCSEVSRWPGNAAETLAGLRAALVPTGELILESTPNGAYGAFYEEWLAGVDAAGEGETGRLVRHFLPWWLEPQYVGSTVAPEAMSEPERRLVAQQGLSGAQIGFRRSLERSYGAMRSQEFAEDPQLCFRATGACCFEVEVLEERLGAAPEAFGRRRSGALLTWYPPAAGRSYTVAVDTAGGGAEGDFAAVQVVELSTGLQCAELQERLRPAELARVAAALGREYGGPEGEALLAVERNNHGAAVLAYLETQERYGRLYRQRGEAGWLTSAASKPEIVARLGTLLSESPGRFSSRRLLRECRAFVTDAHGRAGAAPGAHDDLVMAMAIAQAVRAEVLLAGPFGSTESSALRCVAI